MTYDLNRFGLFVPRGLMDSPYTTLSQENRMVANWHPSAGDADETILPSIDTLRNQSRDLERNDAIASGAISNVVTSVVGQGLQPESAVDQVYLGLKDLEAKTFQRKAETIFRLVAETPDGDFARTQRFSELQELVFRAVLLDGDCLIVRRFRKRLGSPLNFCLQVVEASRIETPLDEGANPNIRGGIEYSADGEPIAAYVRENMGHVARWVRVPFYDKDGRLQARLCVHKRYIGQSRGVPYLAPVIEKLKQISRYTEAELMAAVISGMFTVFIKSEGRSVLPHRPGARAGAEAGTRTVNLKSGAIVDLLPGEEIESINPGRPNATFDPFVQSVLKQVGIGLELPYEVLTKHFQSSYSAARGAILEAWRFYQTRRSWLIRNVCEPVWEWVITEAVARDYLDAPGFMEDPFARMAWLKSEWIGVQQGELDPLKEARAATERIMVNHTDSRSDYARRHGRDFRALSTKLLDEEQDLAKLRKESRRQEEER